MDRDKWPTFVGGFLLGVLVTVAVLGTFGWSKYQDAWRRAEAAEDAALELHRLAITLQKELSRANEREW
jgi:hypothetical protein